MFFCARVSIRSTESKHSRPPGRHDLGQIGQLQAQSSIERLTEIPIEGEARREPGAEGSAQEVGVQFHDMRRLDRVVVVARFEDRASADADPSADP